jgi:hypothetical protein
MSTAENMHVLVTMATQSSINDMNVYNLSIHPDKHSIVSLITG